MNQFRWTGEHTHTHTKKLIGSRSFKHSTAMFRYKFLSVSQSTSHHCIIMKTIFCIFSIFLRNRMRLTWIIILSMLLLYENFFVRSVERAFTTNYRFSNCRVNGWSIKVQHYRHVYWLMSICCRCSCRRWQCSHAWKISKSEHFKDANHGLPFIITRRAKLLRHLIILTCGTSYCITNADNGFPCIIMIACVLVLVCIWVCNCVCDQKYLLLLISIALYCGYFDRYMLINTLYFRCSRASIHCGGKGIYIFYAYVVPRLTHLTWN